MARDISKMKPEKLKAMNQSMVLEVLEGATIEGIAEKYSVPYGYVNKVCRDHGFNRMHVSYRREGRSNSSNNVRVRLMSMLLDVIRSPCDSLSEIAKRHGVSKNYVQVVIEDARYAGFRLPGRERKTRIMVLEKGKQDGEETNGEV